MVTETTVDKIVDNLNVSLDHFMVTAEMHSELTLAAGTKIGRRPKSDTLRKDGIQGQWVETSKTHLSKRGRAKPGAISLLFYKDNKCPACKANLVRWCCAALCKRQAARSHKLLNFTNSKYARAAEAAAGAQATSGAAGARCNTVLSRTGRSFQD